MPGTGQTYVIGFKGVSARNANMNADSLKDALLNASEDVKVEQRREDEHALDFGATLVVVLGTPSIIAVAKAIGDWLKLHHSVEIEIKTPDGKYIAKNVTAQDAQRLAELFQGKL